MVHSVCFQNVTNEALLKSKACRIEMFYVKQKFDVKTHCEFWCQSTDYTLRKS